MNYKKFVISTFIYFLKVFKNSYDPCYIYKDPFFYPGVNGPLFSVLRFYELIDPSDSLWILFFCYTVPCSNIV